MSSSDAGSLGEGDDGADYYTILGIAYTATDEEIARAYRRAMKQAHPDRHRPHRRAAAEERAKLVNQAYAVLANHDARARYDTRIKSQAVQDQIMNRYFGGFAMPGREASDPLGDALRRKRTTYEQAESRQADRQAIFSILLVFGSFLIAIVLLLAVWQLLSVVIARIP